VSYAVLFPGQGSQHVGMGAELFESRPDLLGEAADGVLGWSLRNMCLEGPEETLTRTEHAQPALYAISYALWEAFREAVGHDPAAMAGHSLGEYTALAAAGAFDFETGLALVAERGRAMAEAADAEPSGMAALIGVSPGDAERVAQARRDEGGRLWVANLNAPGQVVVAGGADDLEWLARHAADHGIRRVIALNVAGAFHSQFMAPAAARLEAALRASEVKPPQIPVWSNTTAEPHGSEIVETLVEQVVAPVRFAESLENMAATGISTFVHVGPGDVTAGMARKTIPGAQVLVVSSLDDIPGAVQSIGTM
jgi:malonyl CoA-acyl carrier protein transacylase